MTETSSVQTYSEYYALLGNINLLNVDEYDLPQIRAKVDEYEKKAQAKNQKSENLNRQEEDNKEDNLSNSDIEEGSTEQNTIKQEQEQEQKQKQENKNEEEKKDYELYDCTLAYEMRPFSNISSEDEFYNEFPQVETNEQNKNDQNILQLKYII